MELLQLEFARDFFSPIFARLPPSKCRPVWHAPPVATPLSLFFVAWPGYQHNFWEKICANNILQLLKVKIIFHIKQSHNAEKQRGMGGNHRPLGSPKVKHGLPSLDLRRLHLDLVYCYKMFFFGLVKLYGTVYQSLSVLLMTALFSCWRIYFVYAVPYEKNKSMTASRRVNKGAASALICLQNSQNNIFYFHSVIFRKLACWISWKGMLKGTHFTFPQRHTIGQER